MSWHLGKDLKEVSSSLCDLQGESILDRETKKTKSQGRNLQEKQGDQVIEIGYMMAADLSIRGSGLVGLVGSNKVSVFYIEHTKLTAD